MRVLSLRPYISPDRWTGVSLFRVRRHADIVVSVANCPSVWRHIKVALQLAMAHTTIEITGGGMAGNLPKNSAKSSFGTNTSSDQQFDNGCTALCQI